jgi:hypothetical protein
MAMPVRPKPKPGQQRDATSQATQATMYIMPLMTLIFGLNFPSGLALYWCVGTLFMAVQQYFIGGWGSLFVGIPGMERFVPEPKVLPSAVLSAPAGRAGSAAATRTGGARALAAPEPEPQQSGGFRGMLKQLREQMATAQRQAADTQAAREAEKNGKVVDSTATVADAEAAADEQPFTVARAGSAGQRAPRQRQRQQGPTLVKPAYKAGAPNGTANGASADGADEAAANASTAPATSTPTPASNAGAAKASNGSTPRPAGSATQTRPSVAGPQRKPAGSGKGASSGRPRNNGRPKGGR